MSLETLEQRLAALEQKVNDLLAPKIEIPERDAWQTTLGMIADDPIMREIGAEARRFREEDRKQYFAGSQGDDADVPAGDSP